VTGEIAARLASRGIQLVSETRAHYLFSRDQFVVLVERKGDGFGSIGSTGMMTETGLAYLMWRGGCPLLKGRSIEVEAAADQVAAMRQFSSDLQEALTTSPSPHPSP
jgi:hypothetical protein